MPKIYFKNEELTVEVEAGTTVKAAADAAGIVVRRTSVNCGGRGLPGCSCKVWVRGPERAVSPKSFVERIPGRTMVGELRLACQAKVFGDLTVATQG